MKQDDAFRGQGDDFALIFIWDLVDDRPQLKVRLLIHGNALSESRTLYMTANAALRRSS